LGLSIVAAVAEAHGGTVTVDTAPGEGARFVVALPVAQAPRMSTSVASGT
ncbi:MAG TPA: ATP-binding protein, partial [Acidimicrobiia bacterium]|nr:ATP-binding protein [Acidimicrobiia bacterium]